MKKHPVFTSSLLLVLSPIQTRLANIDHTVNGTFDKNDILTKQSVSEMLLATPVVRSN